jgi:hypothetical protein
VIDIYIVVADMNMWIKKNWPGQGTAMALPQSEYPLFKVQHDILRSYFRDFLFGCRHGFKVYF